MEKVTSESVSDTKTEAAENAKADVETEQDAEEKPYQFTWLMQGFAIEPVIKEVHPQRSA